MGMELLGYDARTQRKKSLTIQEAEKVNAGYGTSTVTTRQTGTTTD